MTLAYQNDQPEQSTLTIRVYPPKTSQSTVTTTRTVTTVGNQNLTRSPDNFSGPLQRGTVPESFQGPPPALYTTQTLSTSKLVRGTFATTPVEFVNFSAYEYNESFLTPSDGWSFTLAPFSLSTTDRAALLEGSKVEVVVDGNVSSTGYIDDVRTHGSRSGGSQITITGRDWLSPAVDGHIDPSVKLKASMSLEDLLTAVFSQFGMQVQAIDNIANKNAITGRVFGTPTSKKGKPLKSYILHEIKPYPQEGAFAFASRVSQRFGLWIWPAADGQTVVVGEPDFFQAPRYAIRNKVDSSQDNNVEDWDVETSRADQPSVIFASGFGGGGEFPNTTLRSFIVNPLVAITQDQLNALIKPYPGIVQTQVPIPAQVTGIATTQTSGLLLEPNLKTLYLYDPESHDQAELQAYLRRELSLHMRKSLSAKYTIEGSRLGGQTIAVDTIVDVDDDISNLHIPLWISERRFSQAAGSVGTKTTITCIRPGTLAFGPGATGS